MRTCHPRWRDRLPRQRWAPQLRRFVLPSAAAYFYAFDLLWLEGKDLRKLPLLDRKRRLQKLLKGKRSVLYVEHVTGFGKKLFQAACALDLEGIVCKPAESVYTCSADETSWVKIKNPSYSQAVGRDEMFDPEAEPSPWRGCELAMRAVAG